MEEDVPDAVLDMGIKTGKQKDLREEDRSGEDWPEGRLLSLFGEERNMWRISGVQERKTVTGSWTARKLD